MTERQLIEDHIPELSEIVGETRKLTQQEYEDWRSSVLNSATEKTRGFTERAILLIEQCLQEEKCA